MTYLQFHFVFTLPVIVLLALRRPTQLPIPLKRSYFTYLGWILLLAFSYTTPWDNYLVYREIWGYGPDRVLFTIGYVPFEEYLFFLLQPILTGLWMMHMIRQFPPHARTPELSATQGAGNPWFRVVLGTYLLISILGAWMLTFERGTYMGLILAWAAPVLAGQWYLGGRAILRYGKLFAASCIPPTLWLWIADAYAIRNGIWYIVPETTFEVFLFGLPLEEATFFLVTNLLVVQGLFLFLQIGSSVDE